MIFNQSWRDMIENIVYWKYGYIDKNKLDEKQKYYQLYTYNEDTTLRYIKIILTIKVSNPDEVLVTYPNFNFKLIDNSYIDSDQIYRASAPN